MFLTCRYQLQVLLYFEAMRLCSEASYNPNTVADEVRCIYVNKDTGLYLSFDNGLIPRPLPVLSTASEKAEGRTYNKANQ